MSPILSLSSEQPRWWRTWSMAAALGTALVAFSLLTGVSSSVSAAPATQCNGEQNGGGTQVACTVTVVNYVTSTGTISNVAPSTVVITRCVGASGPVSTLTCTTTTLTSTEPVVLVQQCNGSANGGGGTVRCSATVTNNFSGAPAGPIVSATNYACIGSVITGTGAPGTCTPVNTPGVTSVTAATIGQCNGSGNGGTSVGFTCTGATGSTMTSTLPVNIDQCNGSGNGGGSLVICSASVTNVVMATPPTPTPVPAVVATPLPTAAPPVAVATPVASVTPPVAVATPVTSVTPPTLPAIGVPTPIVPRPAPTGNAGLLAPAAGPSLWLVGLLAVGTIGLGVSARQVVRARAER